MVKNIAVTLLVALFVITGSAPAFADDVSQTIAGEPSSTTVTNTTADDASAPNISSPETAQQNAVFASRISKAYNIGVTETDVAGLRSANYGYGEIGLAYELSVLTGKPISEITALRAQKLGWGVIAKNLGVHLSKAVDKAATVIADTKESKSLKDSINKEQHSSGNANTSTKSKGSSGKGANGNSGHGGGGHGGGRGGK